MNQKIIDKIKKLLALSSSPNAAEAQSALNFAMKLMEEYGIKIIEEKTETIIESSYNYETHNPHLNYALIPISSIIGKLFHCATFIRADKPVFVGFETNVEVCKHAMDCVIGSLWYDYKKERQNNKSIAFSVNFWESAVEGLRMKYEKVERSENGIVLYDKVREYLKKYKFGSYVALNSNTNVSLGRAEGLAAGRNAEIRPGLTSTNTGRLLK